jgi:hypothetical protein
VNNGALVFGGLAALLVLRARDSAGAGGGLLDVAKTIGLTPTYSARLIDFARAIATAEGFYVPGSIPRIANNPGNLVIPNWTGPTIGSERISMFSTVEEGWSRLYRQLQLIVSGTSRVYSLDMTIADMGNRWAPGGSANLPGAWASNVARVLEVSPAATLRSLLA